MKYNGTIAVDPEKPKEPILVFSKLIPFLVGALFGLAMRLLFGSSEDNVLRGGSAGAYGVMLSSFLILVPFAIGAITVYIAERAKRRTIGYYLWAPVVSNTLFVLGTLLLLIEGWICAILIVPVFGVIGAAGGVVMGIVCRVGKWPRHTVGALAILPLLSAPIEAQFPMPDQSIHMERAVHIQASPAAVWQVINHASDIRPEEVDAAWAYRIGVPKPLAGLSEVSDGRLIRHIKMGKNIRFNQVCADWQANRHMRCTYDFNADSFPPGSLDDHVMIGGKYFDIKDTVYTLTPVDGGTDLKISMRFRISTTFNWYAVPLGKALFGNFQDNILEFYRGRVLQSAGATL